MLLFTVNSSIGGVDVDGRKHGPPTGQTKPVAASGTSRVSALEVLRGCGRAAPEDFDRRP